MFPRNRERGGIKLVTKHSVLGRLIIKISESKDEKRRVVRDCQLYKRGSSSVTCRGGVYWSSRVKSDLDLDPTAIT